MIALAAIDQLLAGRAQMGSSLAFHIVFASLGWGCRC
jgi:cytochrome bd-type quinol oxidase subunit 1